jgi:hypothetical protein
MGSVISGVTGAVNNVDSGVNNAWGGLTGAGSIFGGIDGADTAAAQSAEQQGVASSNQIQQSMYNNTSAMLQPWQQAGASGLSQLQSAMPSLTAAFNPSNLQNTPGYQFQLQQGENAISNSAAARGIANSGGTMASLNNYAQGAASTEYQNALQNYNTQNQQTYGMLSGLANYGQTANAQMTNTNQQTGNNMASTTMSGANASGAASIASGNSMSGLLGSVIGAGGTLGAAGIKASGNNASGS